MKVCVVTLNLILSNAMRKINFGEVWIADLSPRIGTEPGKKRPVLVVQDQALLDAEHPSTLIIPLTTNLIENAFPLRVRINAQDKLTNDSDALIDQLRAIDNNRLLYNSILLCDSKIMQKILNAISEVIGFQRVSLFKGIDS